MASFWWFRLGLSFLLFFAIVWLWIGRFDELSYHTLKSSPLIDIGDAVNFEEKRAQIRPNNFVRVSGILGNKAATISGLRAASFRIGRYQVRHLLGSKLYVEYNEAEYHKKFNPFTRINVEGRLIGFGPHSELARVREFFKDHYHQPVDDKAMLIVVDEIPRNEVIYPIFFVLSLLLLIYSFYSSIRGIFLTIKKPA